MYVVPLASHQPVPRELLPFNGPGTGCSKDFTLYSEFLQSPHSFIRTVVFFAQGTNRKRDMNRLQDGARRPNSKSPPNSFKPFEPTQLCRTVVWYDLLNAWIENATWIAYNPYSDRQSFQLYSQPHPLGLIEQGEQILNSFKAYESTQFYSHGCLICSRHESKTRHESPAGWSRATKVQITSKFFQTIRAPTALSHGCRMWFSQSVNWKCDMNRLQSLLRSLIFPALFSAPPFRPTPASNVVSLFPTPSPSFQRFGVEVNHFGSPAGLDEPRPHMLLGVIVRTKAAFKRPRSMNQRTASPPRKRRPSTGSGNESPLRDSPVAEIDDIVFQFNSGQAKRALPGDGTETTPSRKSAPLSTVAETTSSSTTPSEATSSARASPAKETATSLDVQKQQLLELQERARNYILSQVQAKGTKSGEGALAAGLADKTSEGSEPYNPEESEPYNPEEGTDDETPYDPEEELVLDVEPEKSEKTRPLVATGGESGVSSSGAGQPPLIPLSILAHLPPTASQVPSVSLPGSAPGPRPSLLQDPRTAVASSPGTQASGQPPAEAPLGLMQGSSGPGLRQVAGSAPGPNSAEATRSAPVFQGLKSGAATEDGGSRGSVDRPSFGGGPSQSDHGSSRPNTGDSRFAPSDPPQVGRTVEDLRQRPSEGPHVNPRENTYRERAQVEYGNNRVPPQHDQPGPHQGASHENAPPPSRDFNRGEYFPRGVPGRDPRDRGPGFHDEQFRERREPYGPPRRWSEEDHQRDRDRWRDREPHGRYEDHYDNRRRYEDFRRDDRRHDQYRRDRWRRWRCWTQAKKRRKHCFGLAESHLETRSQAHEIISVEENISKDPNFILESY